MKTNIFFPVNFKNTKTFSKIAYVFEILLNIKINFVLILKIKFVFNNILSKMKQILQVNLKNIL